jgi:hypothetical protein
MVRPLALLVLFACPAVHAQQGNAPADPLGYAAFVRSVEEVGQVRELRRVSEDEFMRMAREPGTVVIDARSERLYRLRHVVGAVNLPLTEFTAETLARAIPSKDTRILIYCNNNFENAPESMPVKAIALNLSTFVSLNAYGYRNVYEFAPVIDVEKSRLAFAGAEVR